MCALIVSVGVTHLLIIEHLWILVDATICIKFNQERVSKLTSKYNGLVEKANPGAYKIKFIGEETDESGLRLMRPLPILKIFF